MVGQKKAITAVANAVRRARAGLQDENRPIGSFLFLGPTGVGKTELSKALAEFLFDDEGAMVRIDETVIFNRLNQEDLITIVELQLDRVRKRLAKQGLGLALTGEIKDGRVVFGKGEGMLVN